MLDIIWLIALTVAQLDKFIESVFRVYISQSSNRIFVHGKKISSFKIANGVSKFDCCMIRNPCKFGNYEPLQIFQLKSDELWLISRRNHTLSIKMRVVCSIFVASFSLNQLLNNLFLLISDAEVRKSSSETLKNIKIQSNTTSLWCKSYRLHCKQSNDWTRIKCTLFIRQSIICLWIWWWYRINILLLDHEDVLNSVYQWW